MEGTTKCGTFKLGTTSTTNVVLFVVLQANKTFNFFRQLMIWQLTSELLSNPSSSNELKKISSYELLLIKCYLFAAEYCRIL